MGRPPAIMDGDLGSLHVHARCFRDTDRESLGIAALYDELAEQVPELIARELSDGSLRLVIRSLSDSELVRLLTMLADLRGSLEEQRLFCSVAMISLVQDRVRNEHRWRAGTAPIGAD